jgi:PTS system nitrogen regulatory IIA component
MLLSVPEAAKLLQVPEKTVTHWIRKESLPACKVNDEYRLNRLELLEWATDHGVRFSPELFAPPESPEGQLPPLSEALSAGGIHYSIPGGDKQSVLQGVVATFKLPSGVDPDFLLQVLLAREALGTTAIGDGIAIPHVRNPILLHVSAPAINLCFLDQPIDFAAMDGKPVHTLFTLISPTVRVHLHLLSKLAYALRNEIFQAALQRRASAAEILTAVDAIESELAAQKN